MRVVTESFHRPDVARMKAAVSRLVDNPEDADDVTIDVRISGGCPGQRVQFQTSIPARGAAQVSQVNDLHSVREEFSTTLRAEELRTLARHLDIDALMALPPNADERYIPDSIVGTVAVTAGNTRFTLWFPLEEESAMAEDEEVAMRIDPGYSPFVLRASMAPASVRPLLEQVATVVNRLSTARS
jgi:hypothetical protein